MVEINAVLLSIQILMHIGITLRLMTYRPGQGATYKAGVSILAATLAGSSAVCAFKILSGWPVMIHETAQPYTTLFVAVVLAGTLRSRGNLACFLPR